MKVLTLHQPYLAGVVRGDGWVSPLTIGLRVADHDFAEEFAKALWVVFGVAVAPKRDERGYWLVRVGNKTGRFDVLKAVAPRSKPECRSWLRGLFDSEGNAQLLHRPAISPAAYQRRVSIYSTDEDTIETAAAALGTLGLGVCRSLVRATAGHLGSKPVYELRLAASRAAFATFAHEVGSSIKRKQKVLDAIPLSYQPPGHHARIQAQGVAVRNARAAAGGTY